MVINMQRSHVVTACHVRCRDLENGFSWWTIYARNKIINGKTQILYSCFFLRRLLSNDFYMSKNQQGTWPCGHYCRPSCTQVPDVLQPSQSQGSYGGRHKARLKKKKESQNHHERYASVANLFRLSRYMLCKDCCHGNADGNPWVLVHTVPLRSLVGGTTVCDPELETVPFGATHT